MSFARQFRWNQLLFIFNALIFVVLLGVVYLNFRQQGVIEARRIILRGENGQPNLILQGDNEHTLITLNDKEGKVRLQLQGGEFPALLIKNGEEEVVGTFFPLQEGGTAIGLGDLQGRLSTFIKGGSSPGVSFFHHSNQPTISLGIADNLPHLLLVPTSGQEGMLLHGNAPASLLFIDEKGKVQLSLSRFGLYQEEKEEKEGDPSIQEGEVFSSWDALKSKVDPLQMH